VPTQTELNQLDIKNNKKKISFLSAILFVTGSSIGAGIFLKDGEIIKYAHGSIVLAIASWLIAFVGILAMAFALLEVLSAKSSNNEGIVD
jgi:amino acid transporter